MFDAIVVGSGMSGGWAAKELTERGLKTLVLERGRAVTHGADYTDFKSPWEFPDLAMVPEREVEADYAVQSRCYAFSAATKQFWVKDSDHPYTYPADKPFYWIRGYHLGGRSLTWGRQTYRMSDLDFEANARDGHGSDWPIRYRDLAPWYDHVETFAGISGSRESLPQLPDGRFLPAMALTDPELDFKRRLEAAFPGRRLIPGRCAHLTEAKAHHQALGRSTCQYRSTCERGCSYGAYFSSLSATLPAARATGNLTVITDAVVQRLVYNEKTRRVTGVQVIDANTLETRTYTARIVFLCASAIPTAQILLNSTSASMPGGLANRSGAVGRYLMDHLWGMGTVGVYPGFEDIYHRGRRPTGFYIPRYQNLAGADKFLRGFGYQGAIMRASWKQKAQSIGGIGAELKAQLRTPGPWTLWISGFGEMLPNPANRITLNHARKDRWGMPIVHIDCAIGDNERAIIEQSYADARDMFKAVGARLVSQIPHYGGLGLGIHEMGTAHMGTDPAKSVLNKFNQAHDVANLFIADGAAMASGGCQNPSLTYMALSARAAHHASELLKAGKL